MLNSEQKDKLKLIVESIDDKLTKEGYIFTARHFDVVMDGMSQLLKQCNVSGSLPLADLETKVEGFIQQHRKICWEAEFEQGEFCVGENRLRDFVRRLKRQ